MGLPELSSILSSILWRERTLLDLLLFKLEEERLVLGAGLDRWRARATHEVEMVLAELRRIEGRRAGALDALATELGLRPGQSLAEMAAAAPPPWDGLLEQHREAFVLATREIAPLEQAHRDLLGADDPGAALAWLETPEPVRPIRDRVVVAPAGGRTLRLVPTRADPHLSRSPTK